MSRCDDGQAGQFAGRFLRSASSRQSTTQLLANQKTWLVSNRHAVIPGSAADRTRPAFQQRRQIVQIDDVPISNYGQINRELARKADQKITVVVERAVQDAEGQADRQDRANSDHRGAAIRCGELGLVMEMGRSRRFRPIRPPRRPESSPATVIAQPGGDPMTLPDRLRRDSAGKTVEVTLEAGRRRNADGLFGASCGEPTEILASVKRSTVRVAVAALGIAYQVLNEVDRVIEGSPAAKAGMKPGDVIVQGQADSARQGEAARSWGSSRPRIGRRWTFDFGEKDHNWPSVDRACCKDVLPGTKVEVDVLRQKQGAEPANVATGAGRRRLVQPRPRISLSSR